MIQLQKFTHQTLPPHLKWQIFSFIRIEWPNALPITQEFFTERFHPIHFVLVDDELLVGHVAVVWKQLTHAGQAYKTYGLVSVLIYPSYRKQGHGLRLVTEAKQYIEKLDGDVLLFFSHKVGFYEKAGFIYMNSMKVLKGDPKHPILDDDRPYMLFLSEKARAHRSDFESESVYFGENVW
jgi:predicted acetyltransferase